jgi:hypothetical protein
MRALIVSIGLFGLAWLAHLIWWRVNPPRHHTLSLLIVFIMLPIVGGFFWFALDAHFALSLSDIPAMLTLYSGAAACYMITYAGIEQTSPSLLIVRALDCAGSAGCARIELAALISEDVLVWPRIEALCLDGLLQPSDAGWVLTSQGRKLAHIGMSFARFFNIRESA